MSEKAPTFDNNEISDIVTIDANNKGHRPDGKFLSQHHLDLIAEHQDKIRNGVADKPNTVKPVKQTETTAQTDAGELRPVEDGEYADSLRFEYNTNPDHEDYLPVGVMAHEPWTIASKDGTTVPEQPPVYDNGSEPATEDQDGRYSFKNTDLYNDGRDDFNNHEIDDPYERNEYGYAGPVEPGSGIELAGPTDIEPYNPGPTDIEPVKTGGELVQLPEVDPELLHALDAARTRYAEETAKSRKSYIGRFLRTDSRVAGILRKVPGVERAAEGLNGRFDQSVVQAKEQYEALYNQVGEVIAAELRRVGWDDETIHSLSLRGNIAQDAQLETEILYQRQAQSKDSNTFVNWWVAQKGFTGKLKKAGVVVAAGAATGLTAGLFAGAVGAFIAGGASGAAIANHVTKRRANSIDESGVRLAVRQSNVDHSLKRAAIASRHNAEEWGSVDDITGRTERRTDEEMLGNRKRIKTATLLGAAAGKGAFKLKEAFDKPSTTPKEAPTKPKPQPEAPKHTPDAQPAKPITPRPEAPINGREFYVDPGHGFTHEIQEFAQANGSTVDARKAFDIYNEAVTKFGKDGLIEPMGTYLRKAGDFGINAPGNAQWKPGVAEFFKSKLQ